MNRRLRLIQMILSISVLLLIGWFANKDFSFIAAFWFASGALMLILLTLVDQPFFSKDSNIFVNGVTAGLSLLLVPKNERDVLFCLFVSLALYLIISSYTLMFLRKKELGNENTFIQFLARINRQIGKPEVIFSLFLFWGAIKQFTINSSSFNAILWFWLIFMLINVPSVAKIINSITVKKTIDSNHLALGKIFGVQSKNTFLVRLSYDSEEKIQEFDFVEFKYSIDQIIHKGMVIDAYLLNQEQWLKILCTPEIEELCKSSLEKHDSDVVYKITEPMKKEYMEKFIGIVTDNSRIDRINILYNSCNSINEGSLVELSICGHKVLYQVVQGISKIERLEDKNETNIMIAEAIQLGEWNGEQGIFCLFGWVPTINTPVYIASNIDKPEVEQHEYEIGCIPETNYPVIMNLETAVTHHTAILGVTGSGKSVFTRNLIKEIVKTGTKTIVVDLTGEYSLCYSDLSPIMPKAKEKEAFKATEDLLKTLNTRYPDTDQVKAKENRIKRLFYESIKSFLEDGREYSLFELSDISNSPAILEYTKWFFFVLFKTVKVHQELKKRVCVILEEAHTIIPEVSTSGAQDFASKATVNSISQIALQGRKYNIGFIVIAQRTANVSKTVLTQCNSIITFQEFDKTSKDFLSNHLSEGFLKVLPTLGFRKAIAVGKAFRSTVPMIFEVPVITEEKFIPAEKPIEDTVEEAEKELEEKKSQTAEKADDDDLPF